MGIELQLRPMKRFPPRLHVLLARESPHAVVIRRGPSSRVCTVLWDRSDDRFQLGQWFKGRIYTKECDVSPDGRYLIYHAFKGTPNPESGDSWTAVSRVPYLKALDLYPGAGCISHGGGLFTGNTSYWLAGQPNPNYSERLSRELQRDTAFNPMRGGRANFPGLYAFRLIRDGWKLVTRERDDPEGRAIYEKPFPDVSGLWLLRKIKLGLSACDRPGKGIGAEAHELVRTDGSIRIDCPDWEWADVDGSRLVWAAGGRLFAGRLDADGLIEERELSDFNGMEFTPLAAPY